jgi:hypothetical protein
MVVQVFLRQVDLGSLFRAPQGVERALVKSSDRKGNTNGPVVLVLDFALTTANTYPHQLARRQRWGNQRAGLPHLLRENVKAEVSRRLVVVIPRLSAL